MAITEGHEMNPPTAHEIAAAFRREFPRCVFGAMEQAFLLSVHLARKSGMGYGWMRQAIGIAWKLEDPVGYIDDARIIELHTQP